MRKRVRITKKTYDGSGRRSQISTDKEIMVKAGWKDGTKITFEREGDESPGVIPADIIFTLQSRPHDRFTREGNDLMCVVDCSLRDALCGVRTSVLTLDNRTISITAPHVDPSTVKIIAGEGMPHSKVSLLHLSVSVSAIGVCMFHVAFHPFSLASWRSYVSDRGER